MIPRETIDTIFNTARIDEVVGDFVNLKKEESITWAFARFITKKHPHLRFLRQKEFINALVAAEVVMW